MARHRRFTPSAWPCARFLRPRGSARGHSGRRFGQASWPRRRRAPPHLRSRDLGLDRRWLRAVSYVDPMSGAYAIDKSLHVEFLSWRTCRLKGPAQLRASAKEPIVGRVVHKTSAAISATCAVCLVSGRHGSSGAPERSIGGWSCVVVAEGREARSLRYGRQLPGAQPAARPIRTPASSARIGQAPPRSQPR